MENMKQLKQQGIDLNECNPFESELPDYSIEYTYEQILELLGDVNNEEND